MWCSSLLQVIQWTIILHFTLRDFLLHLTVSCSSWRGAGQHYANHQDQWTIKSTSPLGETKNSSVRMPARVHKEVVSGGINYLCCATLIMTYVILITTLVILNHQWYLHTNQNQGWEFHTLPLLLNGFPGSLWSYTTNCLSDLQSEYLYTLYTVLNHWGRWFIHPIDVASSYCTS